MATTLGQLELDEAAKLAAENWRQFECFCWHRAADLDDADQWSIVYTHHRDSGLLDQSNAVSIAKALDPFTDGDDSDATAESHNHWAVGHLDGFAI